jgi:hypothetical protein
MPDKTKIYGDTYRFNWETQVEYAKRKCESKSGTNSHFAKI